MTLFPAICDCRSGCVDPHRHSLEEERGVAGEDRLPLRQEAKGRPMGAATARANGPPLQNPRLRRTRFRAAEVLHGLFVRKDSIAQARTKIGVVNHLRPRLLCLASGVNCTRMTAKRLKMPPRCRTSTSAKRPSRSRRRTSGRGEPASPHRRSKKTPVGSAKRTTRTCT